MNAAHDLPAIEPFPNCPALDGCHCVTNSLAKIFNHSGHPLSEEMLLGLGAGMGFIYWQMKMGMGTYLCRRQRQHKELLHRPRHENRRRNPRSHHCQRQEGRGFPIAVTRDKRTRDARRRYGLPALVSLSRGLPFWRPYLCRVRLRRRVI